jgi:hypothetical protein
MSCPKWDPARSKRFWDNVRAQLRIDDEELPLYEQTRPPPPLPKALIDYKTTLNTLLSNYVTCHNVHDDNKRQISRIPLGQA